jgi:cell division protein FtsB
MRRLTPLWLLILILILAIIYLPGLSKYLKLKRKDRDLEQEIARLKSEIARIQEEEHLLKTDLTRLEQVIREELGLVKPGEVVYRVVEEELPAQTDHAAKKEED